MLTQTVSNSSLPFAIATSTGALVEATASGGFGIPLFAASTYGVLTGASFSTSARISTFGRLRASGGDFFGFSVVAEGFGGVALTGDGFAPITLGNPYTAALRTSAFCVSTGTCTVDSAVVMATLSGSRTIDPSALGSYLLTPSASGLTATVNASADVTGSAGVMRYENTVRWLSQTSTFEYEYLLNSRPSFSPGGEFNGLTLALGEIVQGASPATRAFSIFNFSTDAANTIGIDLDAVSGAGDTAALTTNLALFDNLGAGDSAGFSAFLDSSTLGDFSATYRLRLSDADFGAGQRNRGMLLRLSGSVAAAPPPAAVPVPSTLAMLSTGLALFSVAARRRAREN